MGESSFLEDVERERARIRNASNDVQIAQEISFRLRSISKLARERLNTAQGARFRIALENISHLVENAAKGLETDATGVYWKHDKNETP